MKAGIDVNHGNGTSFYSDTDSLKSSVLGSTPLPLNSDQSASFGDYYSLQVKKLENESKVITPFAPLPVDIINMHGDLNRVVPAGFIMLYNKLDEIQKESSQKGSTFLGAGLGGGALFILGGGLGDAAGMGEAEPAALAVAGPGTIAMANTDWDAYRVHMENRDAAERARRQAAPAVTPLTVMGPGNIAIANTDWDAYKIHMLKRDAMAKGQQKTTSEVVEEETTAAEQTYTDYLMKNGATADEVETAKATAEALQTGASSNPRYNNQPSNYLLAKQAIDTIPRGTWQYNVIMNFISTCERGDMVTAQNLWEGENGAREAILSYKTFDPTPAFLKVKGPGAIAADTVNWDAYKVYMDERDKKASRETMGPGNLAAETTDWDAYTIHMKNRDAAEKTRREMLAFSGTSNSSSSFVAVQTYTDYLVENGATVDEVETVEANVKALQTGATNSLYRAQPSNYLLAKQYIDAIPRGTWQYNVVMNYITACESGDMVTAQNLWDGESGAREAISYYSSPDKPLTVMGPGSIAMANTNWDAYTVYMDNRNAAEKARRESSIGPGTIAMANTDWDAYAIHMEKRRAAEIARREAAVGPGSIAMANTNWDAYTVYMDNRNAAEKARREAAALNERSQAEPSTTATFAETAGFKSSFEALPLKPINNEVTPQNAVGSAADLLKTIAQGSTADQKQAIVKTLGAMGITEEVAETISDPKTMKALSLIVQQETSKTSGTRVTAAQAADPSKVGLDDSFKQRDPNTPSGANGQLYTVPSAMTDGDFSTTGAVFEVSYTVLNSGVGIAN